VIPNGDKRGERSTTRARRLMAISDKSKQTRPRSRTGGSLSRRRASGCSRPLTKVQYLDRLEESVLAAEVLHRPLAAVILDVGETAGPKHVVITAARGPIEVRHSALIVHHVDVPHEVRGPGGLAALQQIARQDLIRAHAR